MLHIKAQCQSLNWFWRSFLKVSTTYGRGNQAQLYIFFFHYSQKLSHDIWFLINQQFLRKTKFKFENGVDFVEDQIITLTFDIHVASLNHLVQCSYQLWDYGLQ